MVGVRARIGTFKIHSSVSLILKPSHRVWQKVWVPGSQALSAQVTGGVGGELELSGDPDVVPGACGGLWIGGLGVVWSGQSSLRKGFRMRTRSSSQAAPPLLCTAL